jgi:hypothetical protein
LTPEFICRPRRFQVLRLVTDFTVLDTHVGPASLMPGDLILLDVESREEVPCRRVDLRRGFLPLNDGASALYDGPAARVACYGKLDGDHLRQAATQLDRLEVFGLVGGNLPPTANPINALVPTDYAARLERYVRATAVGEDPGPMPSLDRLHEAAADSLDHPDVQQAIRDEMPPTVDLTHLLINPPFATCVDSPAAAGFEPAPTEQERRRHVA